MAAVRNRRKSVMGLCAIALAAIVASRLSGDSGATNDAIARLGSRLAAGNVSLEYDEHRGYLPSVLRLLGISVDSQVLVFSKTSFQHALIHPGNPRALYYNDNVAIGTVPGGTVYEMVALEPSHGLAFYTLDTRRTDRPQFQRRGVECLF